jgi:uncharacterized protein
VVYVDTSVLVALLVPEAKSAVVARWYARSHAELVSAVWCVTEFASALGIKQRTGQLDALQAQAVWQRFLRLVTNDMTLLPLDGPSFHRAAGWSLDAASALRAGDALHLASAAQAGAKTMATLDAVLARNAQRLKMKLIAFA